MKTTRYSLVALVISTFLSGCGTSPNLTPARDLVGTWRTAFPVTFYIETDWCDGNNLQLMLKQKRMITWVITEDGSSPDDNAVSITTRYESSDTEYIQLCLDNTGITPDVSPTFLTGTISGAYLTVKKGTETFGEFSFTTSNMEGDWSASTCPHSTCQRVYTVKREFKLNKVN